MGHRVRRHEKEQSGGRMAVFYVRAREHAAKVAGHNESERPLGFWCSFGKNVSENGVEKEVFDDFWTVFWSSSA